MCLVVVFGCWKYKDNRRTSPNVKHPLSITDKQTDILIEITGITERYAKLPEEVHDIRERVNKNEMKVSAVLIVGPVIVFVVAILAYTGIL